MLLREARSTYRQVIRVFLAEAGFEDVPRNGAFVLGSIANHGMPQEEIVQALQVSKQAASQLIDALVVRGYLERVPDASDRRRITLNATERGRAAGNAVRAGVRNLDLELTKRLAPEDMVVFRAGLIALAEIGEAGEKSPSPDDF
jgi:DNA-binding MarR family transcriptional regulator